MQSREERTPSGAVTPIWPHFRKILSQSFLYGAGNIASGFLHLAVVVILTRHLTREGYGIYENAFVWFILLSEVLGFGLVSSLFRYYNRADEESHRLRIVSTAFLFVLVVAILVNILLFFWRDRLSVLIFAVPAYSSYLLYAGIAAGLMVPARLVLAYIRILERPVLFTAAILLRVGTILAGLYVLVVRMDRGPEGAVLSLLISNLVLACWLVPWLLSRVRLRFSGEALRGMLSFGVPYIPAGISMWVLSLSDRYLLTRFDSLESVGLYSVAYRLGMAMALVLAGFQLAWPQFAYSLEHAEEGDAVYAKTLTYLFMTMITVGLALSLFREELTALVATEKYLPAAYIIPFVAFAYSFEAVYTVTSLGAVFHNRTLYVALSSLTAAGMNVLLNVLMIPRFGIGGAACSTAVSYLLLALCMARLSKRFRAVPYEWSRIVLVALVALALILGSFLLHSVMSGGTRSFRPVGDLALLLSFFPALYYLGFFSRAELRRARDVVSKRALRTKEGGGA